MSSPPTEEEEAGTLVMERNRFDVMLGRGKQNAGRPGNAYFRECVLRNSGDYKGCGTMARKDIIARQIVAHIHSKGGRFLRSTTAATKQQAGGVMGVPTWEVVSDDVALGKVKQAMRDAVAQEKREQPMVLTRKIAQKPPAGSTQTSGKCFFGRYRTTGANASLTSTAPPAPHIQERRK